jgi:hypothetical protein
MVTALVVGSWEAGTAVNSAADAVPEKSAAPITATVEKTQFLVEESRIDISSRSTAHCGRSLRVDRMVRVLVARLIARSDIRTIQRNRLAGIDTDPPDALLTVCQNINSLRRSGLANLAPGE